MTRVSSRSWSFFSNRSHLFSKSFAACASSARPLVCAFSRRLTSVVARSSASFCLPARMYIVSSLKYARFFSYIWSMTATSFMSVSLCLSSSAAILSTLASALEYFVFISCALTCALRKSPAMPFFSGSSMPLSSTTRLVTMSPISPRSRVCTFESAVSEKSAIFFCAAAPYCSTCAVSVRSICLENARTACCSASLSIERSGPASGAFSDFSIRSSCFTGSRTGSSSKFGVNVNWGIFSSIVFTP